MRVHRTALLAGLLLPVGAGAQSEFATPDGVRVPGAVIECATASPTVAAPCGILGAPLQIDHGSTTQAPPTGGSGVVGFLGGIYKELASGLTIGGSVAVSNLPTTQTVTGMVVTSDNGASVAGVAMPVGGSGVTGWLSAIWSKLAGTLGVSVANWPLIQAISGTVSVINLPATQTVAGTVSVSNLPSIQAVTGTVATFDTGATIAGTTLPAGCAGITGWLSAIWSRLAGTLTVSVSNLPANQTISGSIAVTNLPSTQSVIGSVTSTPPLAAFVDCSATIAIAGGTAQLLAVGSAGKSVIIQNVSAGSAGISLTSAMPNIGSQQTFTLPPFASFTTPTNIVFSSPIYAIGTLAGQVISCTLFQ
jgi:hypothetical protein